MKRKGGPTISESRFPWGVVFWATFCVLAMISVWGLIASVPRQNLDNNYEAWLNGFDALIRAGKLFPDWVKSFWYNHGEPLFVFYPPLFFYLAEIPRLLGASLVVSVKVATILSTWGAFFTMYWLGRELWGKWSGLIAASLYLTIPYHFALIYSRGALAENLAYALFPLLFMFIYQLFNRPKLPAVIGLSVVVALLILTNLPSLILITIAAVLWAVGLAIVYKKVPIVLLLIGGIGGLGLSAFYWIPALANVALVQSQRFVSGHYSFDNYFVSLTQLINPFSWTITEYAQLGLATIAIVILSAYLVYHQKQDKAIGLVLLAMLLLTALFMLRLSTPLWSELPLWRYIQFPFRFLGAVALTSGLLAGYSFVILKHPWRWGILLVIVLQAVVFSRPASVLRPELYKHDAAYTTYGDLVAQFMLTPPTDTYGGGIPNLLEFHTAEAGYLPKAVDKQLLHDDFFANDAAKLIGLDLEAGADYSESLDRKVIATGTVSNFSENPVMTTFNYSSPSTSRITYRQLAFPGWVVTIDGKIVDWTSHNGMISFIVPVGDHQIRVAYDQPPAAMAGRLTSFLFVVLMLVAIYFENRRLRPSLAASRWL